ncbi:MAG: ArsR family transcriptional regulator [Phycisphaeraceae bacterium]|nr:MAG: ArsR family transcriptional regulator [Phycisphaeraceae bacterium]
MPRAPAIDDVFSAIADPRRRQILEILGVSGAMAVGELVEKLRLPQPAVSKHLAVLRRVGAVVATQRGRSRVYRIDAAELKTVYDWTKTFEAYWTNQLDSIREKAESRAKRDASQRKK